MGEITYNEYLEAADYNHLRVRVGWDPMTVGQTSRALEHTTFLAAARQDGRVIGMGRVLFDFGYTAYIGDIIIDPDYQGRGIGREIMERLMDKVEQAAEPGDKIMFILGAAKGKEAFYQKLGFKLRPSELYGAGMTKWVEI